MEQKRQNKQKRRAAFTLAEFLTVIAIVGILASLSFVAGDSLPEKAPPSGDGSDSEGDLSGGAESSDTGSLQWDDSASAPYGGTGGIFGRSKAGKAGNFGRKYSAGRRRKREISTRFSMCRKNRQGSLNRNKKSLAVRRRWCLRM